MYILVRDPVPLGVAVVGVADASLAAYLKFREHPETSEWLAGPFYKAICRVNDSELALGKEAGDFVSITESRLDGQETVVAFRPRPVWPKAFQFFRLYR